MKRNYLILKAPQPVQNNDKNGNADVMLREMHIVLLIYNKIQLRSVELKIFWHYFLGFSDRIITANTLLCHTSATDHDFAQNNCAEI